jgi:hypothetical protein
VTWECAACGNGEGRAEIVRTLLVRKSGPLAAGARKRVPKRGCSPGGAPAERVLCAATVGEVFAAKTRARETKKAR